MIKERFSCKIREKEEAYYEYFKIYTEVITGSK